MTKRKWFVVALTVFLVASFVVSVSAKDKCTTIQDGTLEYSAGHYLEGEPLTVGYDVFGYNYQAHMFKGYYANAYLGRDGFPPYEGDDAAYLAENPTAVNHWAWPSRDTKLTMKWNDAWLSNKDCDGDGSLDRHHGYDSYIGSGAWLTNHMWGVDEGNVPWTYFVKIVAVPADAYFVKVSEDPEVKIWYTADGIEIGPDIWGAFAIVQEVGAGFPFQNYVSPSGPGLGKW